MTTKAFLRTVQSRKARLSVGASAVRGQPRRIVEAARMFLRKVDLRAFGTADEKTLSRALNRTTEALMLSLPKRAPHWGVARKLLNIFLLNCFYTTYLNKEFHLNRAKRLFELPLDSITGGRVSKATKGRLTWSSVKHLTQRDSELFQKAAETTAAKKRIARVHLDALWWSAGRDK